MGISIKVVVAAGPFGAIDEDEKRFPLFNEPHCRRCGTCMGA